MTLVSYDAIILISGRRDNLRIMHLSDLHLGKSVLEHSMIEDQKYILEEIISIIKDRSIDIVLISGDVYDREIPSIEAVNLFSSFLTKLYKLDIKVFVIAGNHDSKERLSFGNELFVGNDIYIEGVFSGTLKKVCLDSEFGGLNIYMLPFAKPAYVRKYYPDEKIETYEDAVSCIIRHTDIDYSLCNIIMVHQFVTAVGVDVERCDSETISLGGIDNVDVSIFKDFDYVAMGHIHGAQRLTLDKIRYAGSPLKYSFSEVNQKKSVCIIDFKGKNEINIELVPLIPKYDMRVIKGPLDKLLDKEVYLDGNVDDYIQAILTDDDYVVDAIGRLRGVYPNILKLEYQNRRNIDTCYDNQDNDIKGKSPMELFENFYLKQNNIELDDNRKKIIKSVIKEVSDEAD